MNTSDPLISVIICTRNRRGLIGRAIDSVLIQRSARVEIVVVDDCSDDGTPDFLEKKYGNQVAVVCLPQNHKVAYATNRGFERAKGDFIALLGDDDYWTDPCKLRKQLDVFANSDHRLGMVGTWWTEVNGTEDIRAREPAEPDDWTLKLLQGGGVVCGSTPLIRRQAWDDAGGLDERMPRGTDSDLFRRIILAGYTGKVLPEHTTVVDIGHGLTRITTRRGFAEARRHAFAHAYLLWKYRFEYFRHPTALLVRIRQLIVSPLKALFR